MDSNQILIKFLAPQLVYNMLESFNYYNQIIMEEIKLEEEYNKKNEQMNEKINKLTLTKELFKNLEIDYKNILQLNKEIINKESENIILFGKYRNEIIELKKTVNSLNKKINDLNSQIIKLNNDNNYLMDNNNKLTKIIDELKAKIAELQIENENLKNDKEILKNDNENLNIKIFYLNEEINIKKSIINSLKCKIELINLENEKKIRDLNSKLEFEIKLLKTKINEKK